MGKLSTLLIRAGYSPVLAEEMDGLLEWGADADLRQVQARALDELGRMGREGLLREARIGWWDSEGVPLLYKRLLDCRDEPTSASILSGKALAADEAPAALSPPAGPILGIGDAAARRAWAEAYAEWEGAGFGVPPEVPPQITGYKALKVFCERFGRSGPQEGHPAAALAAHLGAVKAWEESNHPRYPEGTPVDSSTGAGGGRFAPKGDETSSQSEGGAQAQRPAFPFLDPRPEDAFQRALDRDSTWFAAIRNEELRIYNDAGEVVASAAGTLDSVDAAESEGKMAGNHMVHNHPSAVPFSLQDITMAIAARSASTTVVAGDFVYRIDLPPAFYENFKEAAGIDWGETAGDQELQSIHVYVYQTINKLDAPIHDVFDPAVNRVALAIETANLSHFDISFNKKKDWLEKLGARVTMVERVPGFFVEADPSERATLDAARRLARRSDQLQWGFDPSRVRGSKACAAVTAGDTELAQAARDIIPAHDIDAWVDVTLQEKGVKPEDATVVLNGIYKAVPYAGKPNLGASNLRDLNYLISMGVKTFYFAGIPYALRLHVRNSTAFQGESGDTLYSEFDDIAADISAVQIKNADGALALYSPDKVHSAQSNDYVTTAAIKNHLALVEFSHRHPDLVEYNGVFYPDHNAKAIDPYDQTGIAKVVE